MHVYIHNSISVHAHNTGLASGEEQGSYGSLGFFWLWGPCAGVHQIGAHSEEAKST